jgi:hypothetical protein
MIASDVLTVFPKSNIFDFSQMKLQYVSWYRIAHIPIAETVLSQSTSNCVVDPVVGSSLVLYTTRHPAFRPVNRVLELFLVNMPEPELPSKRSYLSIGFPSHDARVLYVMG